MKTFMHNTHHSAPVALITGAARRIGASIAETLHAQGFNVAIHYHTQKNAALNLSDRLNQLRANSATAIAADLSHENDCQHLLNSTLQKFKRMDVLVNNAACFYKTPNAQSNTKIASEMFNVNVIAPLTMMQLCFNELKINEGTIINIIDSKALKPIHDYSVYCASKAAMLSLTLAMAKEFAPWIRVNAVAPGNIMWPEGENDLTEGKKQKILDKIPLKKIGAAEDIAKTVLFLIENKFITGEIIHVDGGRR